MSTGDKNLDDKIKEYLQYACTSKKSDDFKDLVSNRNYEELKSLFMTRLQFTSEGLRGRMGPGYAAINDLVIVQTSQGLADYVESITSADKSKEFVIGFDNRRSSQRFAELATVAFLNKGFRVYLFSNMTPTPFIPYTVKKLNCAGGVMITASDSPKDYNGYKVFWHKGAPLSAPDDKYIEARILKNLKPLPNAYDTSLVWTSSLVFDPLSHIMVMYLIDMKSSLGGRDFLNCPINLTYTSMHGVAHSYIKYIFQHLNYFGFIPVKEEMKPNSEFPSLTYPSPEEKNCLHLSMMTADAHESSIILGIDPDAGKITVAEKLSNGKWHVFSGNEVGALLGSFLWKNVSNEWKQAPAYCYMVSSSISSNILKSIASKEGFILYETLPGFKNLANVVRDSAREMKFVFAFEANGYMCGPTVLDKDGIQAAMNITSLAIEAYSEAKLLHDVLRETYIKYGYHHSINSYFICFDYASISSVFERLRNYDSIPNQYPEFLNKEKVSYVITAVKDFFIGYDSNKPVKTTLPTSSRTQMITFYFKNGCEATLSGEGLKLEYYAEMVAQVPESEWEEKNNILKEMVDAIVSQWIQPEKNGFLCHP